MHIGVSLQFVNSFVVQLFAILYLCGEAVLASDTVSELLPVVGIGSGVCREWGGGEE